MNKEQWQEAMSQITAAWVTSPFGGFVEIRETEPPKLIDKIVDLPYNIAYYSVRPFAWLIRELWHGLHDGWMDTWE